MLIKRRYSPHWDLTTIPDEVLASEWNTRMGIVSDVVVRKSVKDLSKIRTLLKNAQNEYARMIVSIPMAARDRFWEVTEELIHEIMRVPTKAEMSTIRDSLI